MRVRALSVSDHSSLKGAVRGRIHCVSHVLTLRPDLLTHLPCVDLIFLSLAR